jgi:hypothetical protein
MRLTLRLESPRPTQGSVGATIVNRSLWALVFGAGGTGDSNTLYFTAGLANEGHGLFGAIAAAAAEYPTTITPGAGDANSRLNATASSTVQHYGQLRVIGGRRTTVT